jgi:hypothetical protein
MRYLFLIVQVFIFLFGCSAPTDFKSNCLSAAKILRKAEKRIETVKVEENVKDKIILVHTDNKKAIKFLNSKEALLTRNYQIIKSYYTEGKPESFDALCAMAVLNDLKYRQIGEPIEDHCAYTRIILNQKTKNLPSDWFLNDFYHFLYTLPGFNDTKWLKMGKKDKFERMLKSLLIPDEKGNNCINTET